MKLKDFAAGRTSLPISSISSDRELVKEVQRALGKLGILDPPADGAFGAVSLLAWRTWAGLAGQPDTTLTPAAARLLLDSDPTTLLPVGFGTTIADAIWQAMEAKRYWLTRVPGWINIVYVEGANLDGASNDNRPNSFNDLRTVLTVEAGRPKLLGKWDATTEPGKFFTENPLNVGGAARIELSQFKAWHVGTHGSGTGAHVALVQSGEIRVFRDLNKDFKRDGDAMDTGTSFGVNQHWGFDLRADDIGQASAGCLVGRTKEGHRKFMELAQADPRFVVNHGYRFMTAILKSADIRSATGLPT